MIQILLTIVLLISFFIITDIVRKYIIKEDRTIENYTFSMVTTFLLYIIIFMIIFLFYRFSTVLVELL